jgi:hypothetical protein
VEVALGHAAIAEHDTFEARKAKPDEIEAALEECHVDERRLSQLCTGQA